MKLKHLFLFDTIILYLAWIIGFVFLNLHNAIHILFIAANIFLMFYLITIYDERKTKNE